MVIVPMAQASPKAGAKELSYDSLNLIHEFTSLFSPKVIVAGLPRESFPTEACLCGHQCFCRCATNSRCAQGQPKKEFHRTSKAIAEMNAD